jgi:predicted nucleotidyltransferase
MAGIPKKPEEIFEPFCADFKALYGDDLLSVILYGSCARGEYIPKKSDINFMLLLSENGITQLGGALKTVQKWRRRAVATPLFLTHAYIQTSIDTFPIELLNFQSAYRVLLGEDPLSSIVFNHRMLRLQCERELKGKLLHLREQFLETGGNTRCIKNLIARSLPTFFAIFQGVVFLHGKPLQSNRADLLNAMQQMIGLDEALFADLYAVRDDRKRLSGAEALALMQRYIDEVRRLAMAVDNLDQDTTP